MQAWRQRISSAGRWSDALPALLQLWQEHGTGLIASHSLLSWTGDALVALTWAPACACKAQPPASLEARSRGLQDSSMALGSSREL